MLLMVEIKEGLILPESPPRLFFCQQKKGEGGGL